MKRAIHLFSAFIATTARRVRLAAHHQSVWSRAGGRTILDEQFCQVYYAYDDGKCEYLRASVRSEIRGPSGTPTLELGDHTKKPVMLFFHGWPDTAAVWANQFAYFCGESGLFACVAPSMMDYNPDVDPETDTSKLSWPLQADRLHEVVMDLGLKDITLVMFDFGSVVGSMYVARYPTFVKRAIQMDVGNSPMHLSPPGPAALQSLPFFQQGAINAFSTKSDTAMAGLIQQLGSFLGPDFAPPCSNCSIVPGAEVGVGYKTGWMHNNYVNDNPAWPSFFDTPYDKFEFEFTPTWPDHVPLQFLYSGDLFFQPSLLTFLDARADGSRHARIGDDHWFLCRRTHEETNQAMAAFIQRTGGRTILDEQFCQVYYAYDDGKCERLRSSVRSEIRGPSGTRTLELGDPTRFPVIVFLHGWPDSAALWANQFKRLCQDKQFACVAPSMMDYNPDVDPETDTSKLSWPLQAD